MTGTLTLNMCVLIHFLYRIQLEFFYDQRRHRRQRRKLSVRRMWWVGERLGGGGSGNGGGDGWEAGGGEAGRKDHPGRPDAAKIGRRSRVVARLVCRGAVEIEHEARHHCDGHATPPGVRVRRDAVERNGAEVAYLLANVESTPRR